jgi:hypothetical protein
MAATERLTRVADSAELEQTWDRENQEQLLRRLLLQRRMGGVGRWINSVHGVRERITAHGSCIELVEVYNAGGLARGEHVMTYRVLLTSWPTGEISTSKRVYVPRWVMNVLTTHYRTARETEDTIWFTPKSLQPPPKIDALQSFASHLQEY